MAISAKLIEEAQILFILRGGAPIDFLAIERVCDEVVQLLCASSNTYTRVDSRLNIWFREVPVWVQADDLIDAFERVAPELSRRHAVGVICSPQARSSGR